MRDTNFKEKLEKLYLVDNLNVVDICQECNIANATFYRLLKSLNIKKRKRKVSTSNIAKRIDITGQKFGRLTAKEPTDKRVRKNIIWIFECECGQIIEAQATRVKSGHKNSCGCLHGDVIKKYRMDKNPNWTGYEGIRGSHWSSIQRGAKTRNLEFTISIEYAWKIYESQNRLCKLTKIPIYLDYRDTNKREKTASLDRIDSKQGYVEGNIQWVHKIINYMKMDIEQQEFISLCRLVGENNV